VSIAAARAAFSNPAWRPLPSSRYRAKTSIDQALSLSPQIETLPDLLINR